MAKAGENLKKLEKRIRVLEEENKKLRNKIFHSVKGKTVSVPENIKELFDVAQKTVGNYFSNVKADPTRGTIEINDQRYVLVRASALSYDFLNTIKKLYSDRGEKEAFSIGKDFLFDISHAIGMNDAKNFHTKMNLTDPIAKLSAGPVHFAYSGWAFVDILPQSRPTPDNNYYLIYHHPFSFEADSWIRAGKRSASPVCIMNSGYSSGWCEESFDIPLTAVEVTCKACGDENCTFIMAPPHMINTHLNALVNKKHLNLKKRRAYHIPSFFERKKVEEEKENARIKVEESDKAKSQFLANMSHEIRTPLNSIIGYVDLMLKDKLSAEHREYLAVVKDSGHILQTLINDFLDLSKIEAGQLMTKQVTYSLCELFDYIEATANTLLEQKAGKVNSIKSIDYSINEFVLADPVHLKQVMYNLVTNAVKFTEEGTIEYGVRLKNKKTIEFFVKDTGIGVPEDKHEKIFEMFGQADESSTRKFGGSGLGLTISKKLAEMMGGKLYFESKMGKGSSFYFTHPYLPQRAAGKKAPMPETEPEKDDDFLLLVEDNLINQRLTRIVLEKAGYKVITASNGIQAVEQFKKNPGLDIVIMDVQMPSLDGLAATRAIREFEKKKNLCRKPIIALTAHAMKGDMEKCIAAGCNGYLSKPIDIDLLIKTIRNTFKEKITA